MSDHYQPWRHEGGHAPFSLAWMSAVGERTERVLLGTSVLTPTFRYQPAVIAQAFATMGCLFPGRVMLGVGTGEAMNEVAVTGIEWPEYKERFARLRESVRLMRALWSGERVTFEGDYYRTDQATVYDRPDTPVPIYVAAGGPQVARYAGRAGDGFICTSGKGMELYEEKLLPAVAEGLEKAERAHDEIDRMIEIKLSYDPDPERALENTRFWAPLALTAEQKAGLEDPIEMRRAGDALPIEQVASRWIVASDPDDAVAKVKPYVDPGSTTSSSTRPARTRSASSTHSPSRSCPGCGSSAPQVELVGAGPRAARAAARARAPRRPHRRRRRAAAVQPRQVATISAPRTATSIPTSGRDANASSKVSDVELGDDTAASPGTDSTARAVHEMVERRRTFGSSSGRPGRPAWRPRPPPARLDRRRGAAISHASPPRRSLALRWTARTTSAPSSTANMTHSNTRRV